MVITSTLVATVAVGVVVAGLSIWNIVSTGKSVTNLPADFQAVKDAIAEVKKLLDDINGVVTAKPANSVVTSKPVKK